MDLGGIFPEKIGCEAHIVAGDVIHRAATDPLLIADSFPVRIKGGVLGLQIADPADLAAVDDLLDTLGQLRMAVRISFFQQDMVGLCSGKHFLYLLFVHGEGLFTENVFSRFGHLDGPLHVQPVGQRNVYGIHIFVIQQGLIIRIELLRGKRLRVGLQLFFIPTCNRIEFRIRCRQHGRDGTIFADPGASENTPTNTIFFHNKDLA